jgi:hypothetical protein
MPSSVAAGGTIDHRDKTQREIPRETRREAMSEEEGRDGKDEHFKCAAYHWNNGP